MSGFLHIGVQCCMHGKDLSRQHLIVNDSYSNVSQKKCHIGIKRHLCLFMSCAAEFYSGIWLQLDLVCSSFRCRTVCLADTTL